ncbi:MAG: IS200/IS605 family transposase [Bacteroidota bacterium]
MSNTYSQIHIQIIFAVKGRQSLIPFSFDEEQYKYITGIVQNKKQKMLAINGMPDHIHFFIGLRPDCTISDLVREVKKASNKFVNEKLNLDGGFAWQDGFGAFSYCRSEVQTVINYIKNQKKHHLKEKFKEEYISFLKEFEIEFKPEYLFDWIDYKIED